MTVFYVVLFAVVVIGWYNIINELNNDDDEWTTKK